MTASEVFKALSHVQTLWLTDDGHFHLHSANGGVRVDRDEVEQGEPEHDESEPEKIQSGRKPYKKRK